MFAITIEYSLIRLTWRSYNWIFINTAHMT